MATVVGPGAQTSLVPTLVGEKQMLNEQLDISAIYLKPMTNASNMRPWFWVDMMEVWGVESQGNSDAGQEGRVAGRGRVWAKAWAGEDREEL